MKFSVPLVRLALEHGAVEIGEDEVGPRAFDAQLPAGLPASSSTARKKTRGMKAGDYDHGAFGLATGTPIFTVILTA
jgi:hypothetical protein